LKDRTSLFIDEYPSIITIETGKKILEWCESGSKHTLPETSETPEDENVINNTIRTITQLQNNHNLTKEELKDITGQNTLRGLGVLELEKALGEIAKHCAQKMHNQNNEKQEEII